MHVFPDDWKKLERRSWRDKFQKLLEHFSITTFDKQGRSYNTINIIMNIRNSWAHPKSIKESITRKVNQVDFFSQQLGTELLKPDFMKSCTLDTARLAIDAIIEIIDMLTEAANKAGCSPFPVSKFTMIAERTVLLRVKDEEDE